MTTLTHWTEIPICTMDGDITDADERVEALREYRRDRSIREVWLMDHETLDAWDEDENGDSAAAGPRVEEIDWTGFPE
jgi:hypothetical protein